jgi:hypothetical protein
MLSNHLASLPALLDAPGIAFHLTHKRSETIFGRVCGVVKPAAEGVSLDKLNLKGFKRER